MQEKRGARLAMDRVIVKPGPQSRICSPRSPSFLKLYSSVQSGQGGADSHLVHTRDLIIMNVPTNNTRKTR